MSMELIAIISTAVALAGLILNGQRTQRAEMNAQRVEMQSEFKSVREEIGGLREEIGGLRERMAHLEGLIEGLCEAITGRRVAEGPGQYDPR